MIDENGITITHSFDAPREMVWKAWTEPELIKKWWGPEGFTAPSVKIDLRVGGKYTYAMHGPAGSQWDRDMYSSGVFQKVVPNEEIVTTDFFSDAEGNKIMPSAEGQDDQFPDEMTVTIKFEDVDDGKTKVSIFYPKPENEAHFQAMLKSGMEEGWSSSLGKLAAALEEQK